MSNLSVTSNYVGKFVNELYSSAIYNAGSLARVSILPGLKGTGFLPRLEVGDILTDASCDFTPAGTVALTEKEVSNKKLAVQLEMCKTDLIESFYAEQMRASANNDEIPATLNDYILAKVKEKVASGLEDMFWTGEAYPGQPDFDGIVEQATTEAAADVSAGTISDSNVVAELFKVVDAMPAAVAVRTGNDAPVIYVDYSVLKYYRFAVAKASAEKYTVGTVKDDFMGYELVASPLGANKMIASSPSNLYFLTDLFDDANELRVIDMSDKDGSDNIRVKGNLRAGAAYRLRNEMVVYA